MVEITWKNPIGGTNRTDTGQLWFKDLPVLDGGKVRGFGRPGHYTGIKWFVPKKPGDIWIEALDAGTHPPRFRLHDYFGDSVIVPAFDRIGVDRSQEGVLDKRLDDAAALLLAKGADEAVADLAAFDAPEEQPGNAALAAAPSDRGPGASEGPPRFATRDDIGTKTIALTNVVRIVFLAGGEGIKRDEYRGRYVEFSSAAAGDNGRVQATAATFFGGRDEREGFAFGEFLQDGSIVLAGNYLDLDFLAAAPVTVLGADPASDAYPSASRADPKRGQVIEEPRRTPTLAYFSPDLRRLVRVVRLPWGTGAFRGAQVGRDDGLFLAGTAGPHFGAFMQGLPPPAVVENPAASKAGGAPRAPAADGYVLKLAPGGTKALWAVVFKGASVEICARPDGSVIARRGGDLFDISADGKVSPGAKLDITGSNMAVDHRTGDIYFGGSYRSGTGLEPYVNPYVYKLDASGKQVWTAYGWTGPIVGVEQHRLVADSSITKIKVSEDGSLTLVGWSDGGNTVLSYQPYDMRIAAPGGGFCSSVWGATGGLTVRIAHMIRMNARTMEVDSRTTYVSYLPTSDVPTLINIYDIEQVASGDIAVAGGSWTGYVESHDAWITPWYIEHKTNEHAQAKGGTFFTLFAPDFNSVRMATRTPGVSNGQLTSRGNLVLLYGAATGVKAGEPHRPIVKNAFQSANNGGMDGYAMLIDTRGEPHPPLIPEQNWGTLKGGGK